MRLTHVYKADFLTLIRQEASHPKLFSLCPRKRTTNARTCGRTKPLAFTARPFSYLVLWAQILSGVEFFHTN